MYQSAHFINDDKNRREETTLRMKGHQYMSKQVRLRGSKLDGGVVQGKRLSQLQGEFNGKRGDEWTDSETPGSVTVDLRASAGGRQAHSHAYTHAQRTMPTTNACFC